MSSSLNQPMAVERGRSHELVGSMVGAASSHVLGSLTQGTLNYFVYFANGESTEVTYIVDNLFPITMVCVILESLKLYF